MSVAGQEQLNDMLALLHTIEKKIRLDSKRDRRALRLTSIISEINKAAWTTPGGPSTVRWHPLGMMSLLLLKLDVTLYQSRKHGLSTIYFNIRIIVSYRRPGKRFLSIKAAVLRHSPMFKECHSCYRSITCLTSPITPWVSLLIVDMWNVLTDLATSNGGR